MTEVKIKIPEEIKLIIGEIDEPMYIEALRKIARKKYNEKKKKLNRFRRRIRIYENRYNLTFEEFSKNLPDTKKAHDDWIEWTFLYESIKELEKTLLKLEQLLGK